MAVPRFYKFVWQFDKDVQRFQYAAHVYTRTHTPQDGCRSPCEDCTRLQEGFCHALARLYYVWKRLQPLLYVFLYMHPISMFSKQKKGMYLNSINSARRGLNANCRYCQINVSRFGQFPFVTPVNCSDYTYSI